nr:root abundant protein [Ipomoea batatas]
MCGRNNKKLKPEGGTEFTGNTPKHRSEPRSSKAQKRNVVNEEGHFHRETRLTTAQFQNRRSRTSEESTNPTERSPPLLHNQLPAPGAVLPLVLDISSLHGSNQSLLLWDPFYVNCYICECKPLEVHLAPHHVRGINKCPILINNIDDDDELSIVLSVVDESDPSNFNILNIIFTENSLFSSVLYFLPSFSSIA